MRTASLEANLFQTLTSTREAVLYEIFLDLHKAHDALDIGWCLEILIDCGVGPWAIRLIRTYWVQITMMVKAGGYHAPPLNGFHVVPQLNPLFPKNFTIIMDSVMHHWVAVKAEEKVDPEVLRRLIQRLEDYFYANNSLVALTRAGQLQHAFDVLTDLFNHDILRMNVQKLGSMVL